MKPFLNRLADAILATHGADLRAVAVVLPSQRAGLHLRHALASSAGHALWSPTMLTLPTLAERLSGLRTAPTEELLLHAYAAYRTVEQARAQDLNEFLQWAPTALRDMSTADAHLVPLDGFYRDLRSWEDLDWSFNSDPLSKGQQRMVHYWAMKGQLHTALVARLTALGIGTAGSVERQAAETPGALPFTHVWAAGLNALTPAEERMLAHCQGTSDTRFAWDLDNYYLKDRTQEAGIHLRKAIERFGPGVMPAGDAIGQHHTAVRMIDTPNTVSQAWCAADLLRDVPPAEREHTTVVLADTSLLGPLLEALPEEAGPVNVTMGLPLANLPAGSLIRAFLSLHRGHQPGRGFALVDVERVLDHPYLQRPERQAGAVALPEGHTRTGRSRLWEEDLDKLVAATFGDMVLLNNPFAPVQGTQEMPARLAALLDLARWNTTGDAFANEQLFAAARSLERVHRLLADDLHLMDLSSYGMVLDRLLRAAEVGLYGEPLKGIQVMGLLETRALDARQVIILGAQEGVLPADTSGTSYIPFELRSAYGLPLRDGNDAVQAYNFLRLFHGAEQLTLLVSEQEDSPGPSRFILQLQRELYTGPAAERWSTNHLQLPLPASPTATIAVQKDEAVLERYRHLLRKGLSPSAIGTWLRCPLDHYFRYVMRLQESDEGSARIAPNVLGEALHSAMEQALVPWKDKELTPEALHTLAEGLPAGLRAALEAQMPAAAMEQGQPLLQLGMAGHAADRFLRNEASLVREGTSIVPIAFEPELQAAVPGAVARLGTELVLRGRLDRVDRRNGMVHVLDLKAGRVRDGSLRLPDLTPGVLRGDRPYALQLLVYAWLYLMDHPEEPAVRAGILPLQRPSASKGMFLQVGDRDTITRQDLPAIEALLLDVAARMLDASVPVTHDPSSTYCRFCVG